MKHAPVRVIGNEGVRVERKGDSKGESASEDENASANESEK